nr:LysR substrate-binding domain-containing protein [Lacticaseibacillus camelliae]
MQAGLIDQLQTVEDGSQNLLADLRGGHLDGALLGSTGPLNAPALKVQPLRRVPFTLVVSPDHPLAIKKQLSFAELAAEPFVTLAEGFVHTKAFEWFTHNAGIQPAWFTAPKTWRCSSTWYRLRSAWRCWLKSRCSPPTT